MYLCSAPQTLMCTQITWGLDLDSVVDLSWGLQFCSSAVLMGSHVMLLLLVQRPYIEQQGPNECYLALAQIRIT